jgi:hypothetical protein
VGRQELIAEWEDGISPALAGFEVFQHPHGAALDYSVDSLRGLEPKRCCCLTDPTTLSTAPIYRSCER